MGKKVIVILSIVLILTIVFTIGLGFSYYTEKCDLNEELLALEDRIDYLSDVNYGSKAYGRLRVCNDKLCDENGRPVQLKGMSTHGISWYPRYANGNAFRTLKGYGANVVRIAVYSEEYMNEKNKPGEYLNYIYSAIEGALSHNMYVIIDWHILKEENPNITTDFAIDFFEEITGHYGNHPHILYEICNEPNGDTAWDDVYEYAAKVIPVIRNNAADSIVIVGTPNYCQDVEAAAKRPLPYDNVMYALHMYFDVSVSSGSYGTADYYLDKTKLGIPVFISEWGLKYDSDTIYTEEVDYFVRELEERNISWCNWALSNKDECYSLIKPECPKLSNWTDEELTPGGQLIKKYLKY